LEKDKEEKEEEKKERECTQGGLRPQKRRKISLFSFRKKKVF